MSVREITNREIADVLDQIAGLLEAQDANVHRIRAYRNGAKSVRETQDQLADIVREGKEEKIQEIPGIGAGLARVISTYVKTGRFNLLDRLKGEVDPDEIFKRVPGIGQTLGRGTLLQTRSERIRD